MLNILSILKYIKNGVAERNERYHIADDQHIIDTGTGVELHLYDGYVKLTHSDNEIATTADLSDSERKVLWEIKTMITDPETARQREENYHQITKGNREKLADLFENPNPVVVKTPMMEEDTEEYQG